MPSQAISATHTKRKYPLDEDEYEMIGDVKLRPDDLPADVKLGLASGYWKMFQQFLRQPDAVNQLDAELARLRSENSPLLYRTPG